MKAHTALLSLALACATCLAHADTSKPGKYDYSVKVTVMNMSMPAINFSQCVTRKDIDEGKAYVNKEGNDKCKYSEIKRSGDKISFRMACTNPTMTGEANGTVNAEAFNIDMRTVVSEPMKMEQRSVVTARRVGDC